MRQSQPTRRGGSAAARPPPVASCVAAAFWSGQGRSGKWKLREPRTRHPGNVVCWRATHASALKPDAAWRRTQPGRPSGWHALGAVVPGGGAQGGWGRRGDEGQEMPGRETEMTRRLTSENIGARARARSRKRRSPAAPPPPTALASPSHARAHPRTSPPRPPSVRQHQRSLCARCAETLRPTARGFSCVSPALPQSACASPHPPPWHDWVRPAN